MQMRVIVGIDEVGRGCWAGPLVSAAVVLHEHVEGLRDSKLLSKRQRIILTEKIKQAADFGVGWVTPAEVDSVGLTQAVSLSMQRALKQIQCPYDEIIIDGNHNYLPGVPSVKTLVKADSLVPAASAASILAKVARDTYMAEQAARFPEYGFETHVGYGTMAHVIALKRFGICELHRLSYKPIQAYIL